MPSYKVISCILALFLCLTVRHSFANSCKKVYSTDVRVQKTALSKEELFKNIQDLESSLEKLLRTDIRNPVCWKASVALRDLLHTKLNLETEIVGTTIWSGMGVRSDGAHYFLVVRDYFARGRHLYIDPTILQFAETYPDKKIFVGSSKDLEAFAKARGIFNYFTNFVEEYLAARNHSTSQAKQFDDPEYYRSNSGYGHQ